MKESPTIVISIIIPIYNRRNLIGKAIGSIKAQTFHNWECIIVDDHSTDDTYQVVLNLTKADNRFSCLTNTRDKGAPGARNTGILAAHGDYVVLFDSDNLMHSTFLEKVYQSLIATNADGCASFSRIIDEASGEQIGSFRWMGQGNVYRNVLKEKSYFDNSSTLIRRQKILDMGLLDEKCPSYQEWETHIRLSKNSIYTTVEEELIDYFRGGADTISKDNVRSIKGRLYILNKFRREFIIYVPIKYINDYFVLFCQLNDLKYKITTLEYKALVKLFSEQCRLPLKTLIKILYLIRNVKRGVFH